MKDLLRIASFAGYLAFGLLVAWRSRKSQAAASSRAVNAFLAYTLLTGFGAGLLQRDLWPFSNWPLVAGLQRATVQLPRLAVIDRLGTEHQVDYRAWQPFVSDELLGWADGRFLELGSADRDRAADFLVEVADRGRRQAAKGQPVGSFTHLWGPLTAPYFLLHPKLWQSPATTPLEPFIGLRLYRDAWNLEERSRTPDAIQRVLIYEYRRP